MICGGRKHRQLLPAPHKSASGTRCSLSSAKLKSGPITGPLKEAREGEVREGDARCHPATRDAQIGRVELVGRESKSLFYGLFCWPPKLHFESQSTTWLRPAIDSGDAFAYISLSFPVALFFTSIGEGACRRIRTVGTRVPTLGSALPSRVLLFDCF